MVRLTKSRTWPGVWSRCAEMYMSPGLPSYTVFAADSGVPRFHSLTMFG